MTWIRIDDQFHGHPKVLQAWATNRASLGLHVLALSHSGAYLTDGFVSETWVRSQLPGSAERRRATQALVDAGLWELRDDGFQVHDFLDFNESRETVLTRRAERTDQRSAAGRKGASARWSSDSSSNGKPSAIVSSPSGEQMAPAGHGNAMAPARPQSPFPFKDAAAAVAHRGHEQPAAAAAIAAMRERGIDNPVELLEFATADRVLAACRCWDRKRRKGPGLLAKMIRDGGAEPDPAARDLAGAALPDRPERSAIEAWAAANGFQPDQVPEIELGVRMRDLRTVPQVTRWLEYRGTLLAPLAAGGAR